MPDQALVQIIDEHLPYEIDMLRGIYQHFGVSKINPTLSDFDKKILYFSQIEAFCVHARALLDFFSNKRTYPTDSIAGDFTTGYQPTFDLTTEPLKSLYTKLNKQIFHLTTNRTIIDAEKFQPDKDPATLPQAIEAAITNFTACLTPDFKHFKCNTTPVAFVTVLPQSSATGTFASTSITIFPPTC
jgi:hypothetical protein